MRAQLEALAPPVTALSLLYNLKLQRLPPCLCETSTWMAHLQRHLLRLNLSRNEFKELPPALGTLTALTHLNLSRNKLRRLPTNLHQWQALQALDVSSNDFRNLDALPLAALQALPVLQLLDLRHCPCIGRYGSNDQQALANLFGDRVSITQQVIPPDKKLHAADRDASLLLSQIVPHATGVLRRRLSLVYGDTTDPEHVDREEVLARLVAAHTNDNGYGGQGGPRARRHIQGIPVEDRLCVNLKREMDKWVEKDLWRRLQPGEVHRERTNIDAQHYMILKSPRAFSSTAAVAEGVEGVVKEVEELVEELEGVEEGDREKREEQKEEKEEKEEMGETEKKEKKETRSRVAIKAAAKVDTHQDMWDMAMQLLSTVDMDFSTKVTAIAFTKNFKGSCHIDTQNSGPFYGLSLGDFKAPGYTATVQCHYYHY